MAAPRPGPSRYIPLTAPQKLRILRLVAARVDEQLKGKVSTKDKAIGFTGLDERFIKKLNNVSSDHIEITLNEVDRSDIYNKLMDMYLNEKKMPTTYQLFSTLYGILPDYMDFGDFKNYLFKHGFMWKHIKKSGTCVVIENPKVTFERYLYLKNILRHRKEGKTIYFIDEVAFGADGEVLTVKQSISRKVEPQIRLIYTVTDGGVQFKQFINDFNSGAVLKFIKDTLLKSVSEPSVFVLNNYKHHCEEFVTLPNEDSVRKELYDWLDHFDVPYDPALPKAVLFELAQKYTDLTRRMYVVDVMLREHGHTVLRLPDCIMKLTPASYYFDMLSANMPDLLSKRTVDPDVITTSINQIFDTLNEEHASEYSDVIVVDELAVFLKDEAVDNIMDELVDSMTSTENSGLDSDLPSDEPDSE